MVTIVSRNQASTTTQHCSQRKKTSGRICQNQHNNSIIVAFCRRTVGWFLQQNPGESCSSAGHAAYWDAVSTNQTSFDNGTLSTQVSLTGKSWIDLSRAIQRICDTTCITKHITNFREQPSAPFISNYQHTAFGFPPFSLPQQQSNQFVSKFGRVVDQSTS